MARKRGRRDEEGSGQPEKDAVLETDTDRIVAAALQDARRERMTHAGGDATGEYLSDSDVGGSDEEEEEGVVQHGDGPIQEDMVDVAHAKRAALRKGEGVDGDDTGLVADIAWAEEGYVIQKEVEKEHGIALEAFNLVEERERGYFDREGNYVENVGDTDEEEPDAWLADGQDKEIVDEATRKKIEDRMKEEQGEEGVIIPGTSYSNVDIARIQYNISDILLDGETVAAALKRLAGPSSRGAKEKRLAGPSVEDKASFDSLTEFATVLLDAGETDVYSRDKAYFQTAARVYIDIDDDDDDDQTKNVGMACGPPEDASEDMFASDSELDHPPEVKQGTVFSDWPVKELKRFCEEHGETCQGITEKDDLIRLACDIERRLSARIQNNAAAAAAAAAANEAIFDHQSGRWMSKDGHFFWDDSKNSWQPTTQSV